MTGTEILIVLSVVTGWVLLTTIFEAAEGIDQWLRNGS